jgi:hypothetical protein
MSSDPVSSAFAALFPRSERLRLPSDWREQGAGTLSDSPWLVNWKRDGDDLVFFSSNRFSNDSLARITPDGNLERLGSCMTMYGYRPKEGESREEGRRKAKDGYYAHNHDFYARVEELGLGSPAMFSTTVNAFLRQGLDEQSAGDAVPAPEL